MTDEKRDLFFYDEIYQVKHTYLEIVRGFSFSVEHDLYIKHFTELDKIEIIQKRQEILDRTRLRGVKTDRDALDYLISENLWSQEKEEETARLEVTIEDNVRQANNMVIPAQKRVVLSLVQKDKEALRKMRDERSSLTGLTAEKYADEKYINNYLYFSFYKDKNFVDKFFTEEEFSNLEEDQIGDYFEIYSKALSRFCEENFKKIAASPFFLNSVSFAYEDPKLFLDKSVLDYTNYQLEIFSMGRRNVRVMSESTKNPPIIHSRTKFSDLVGWYDLQSAVSENKKRERDGESHGVRSSIKNR